MDIKTIKTFHSIVEHGSFIRAAEELNYAQSTVTMQIQKLEKDLGVRLFERGKAVQLTEAGRMLREQSKEIVRRMEQLQLNMTDLQSGEAGSVRIGVTDPTASIRLPDLLKKFMEQYPRVKVSVAISSTPALVEQLHRDDIDFAICSVPDAAADFYFQPLFYEPFTLLMPEDHPLAGKTVIRPSDLQEHRLLITSVTCPYRQKLEIALRESGVISANTMEIGSMTALKHYVESGLGIALVPQIMLNPMPNGTITRPMDGSPINMLIGMLCKPDSVMKPAAATLYRYLERELTRDELGTLTELPP
ncbi:LysR family transcriptional regulator [Paenibacillus mesophilus]|uniref:LysR family transcriptional regulator n=1 Tax=Paenibacillus mesophilus TaxID=2582849 RepID=UPI00110D6D53|nr:LysR family transcriptional regulator [Paenibacillus mesophilus]TMV48019.1 LysR family transcriptional regulator [Paenibacillus mesophilus]